MKKKLLSLLLAFAMVFTMAMPAMAAEEETPAVTPYTVPADVKGKLVILHTNDTHGADVAVEGKSIGTAGVAQLKKDFEAAGATVILMNAGDSIQGQPLVSLSKGASSVAFMNAAGYDVMTLGNHEMDYGYENLKTILADAKFTMVGADVLDAKTNKPVFDANKIFEIDGMKIGVFGLATPETLTKADATKMEGITFPQGEDLYKCAQAQVDELKAAGCDLIVSLAHLGVDQESVGNRSIDVAEHVNGIDLIVDGHSHSTTEQITAAIGGETNVVNNTKIVSTGTALANVGVVVYDKDAKTLTDSLISAAAYTKVDETAAKLINDKNAEVDKELSVVFAKTEVEMNGAKDPGNRTEETNLGDFATDALLWAARNTFGEDKVDGAITNGGGIRASIPAGDISMKTMKTVFPFGNTVATVKVTGTQLLEALEAGTYCTPTAIGGFPQVSGIEFTINTGVEYKQGAQYPASTYYAPAEPGSRVTITSVNGQPWDAEKLYTIATNDFTAKGNDTYGVFKVANEANAWTDTAVPMEDALVEYTKEVLGGVITAEKYGQSAGRITIVSEPAAATLPADLDASAWYYDAAVKVLDMGAIKGTDKGFDATGTVTVATVYQTLYNLEGNPKVDSATVTTPEGAWYADAINWAASAKLFDGASFDTDSVITRSALATIVAGYCQSKELTVEGGMAVKEAPDYNQVPEADQAGVGYCYEAGIMKGNDLGKLAPAGELSRAEFAQVLANLDAFMNPVAAAA